ncbi:alpha/beta fold hydrolase [Celerinatantimonas diazotrophica]|uniref:Pimeloyl-ACP methyl ester carboxylesterase n=1 Tax=Celerinatantimonas diazotrophica TaxID=412034 RepID=A0A4R1K2B7_9GAMM|nr:alpha/beta hydrolase [Celerinatantimonas diazotrophica]TCK58070.1 pimeloyl-ACP methyl ester carboxylesterase [Celerinatantimonas diazotrophica]CAG9297861.1 2-succinyl-6-hydroxy-2, 4-cyclohexadiene-1-carboxylate synthase [Celerinatantimonas diazotrophica]
MEINQIILNNNLFRYSLHENEQSDQYVIFLLGALQDIESVNLFSRKFSEYLNCLTIEIPGTGRTNPLDSNINIREQTLMLLEFIHYMDIQSAHLIAISYSTAIAVELCDVWPHVSSMSICGGVPGIPKSGRQATKKMIAAAMQSQKEFAYTFTHSVTVNNPDIPRNKAIIRATQRSICNLSPAQIDIFFENSVRLLVHNPSHVEDIKIPCTVCVGEYDPYATVNIVQQFSQQLKNSNLVIIKNADHLVHLQHPDKTSAAMIALAASAVSVKKSLAILAD